MPCHSGCIGCLCSKSDLKLCSDRHNFKVDLEHKQPNAARVARLAADAADGVKHQKGLPALHLVASCSAAADSMLVAYSDAADFPAASAVSAASLATTLAAVAACVAGEVWNCLKREL